MKTVVVVQRLSDVADNFADWLNKAGYRVRVCTGPAPPYFRCWAHDRKDCPLWQQADLMIYDPWLPTNPRSYDSASILQIERRRHPGTPMLLWGSGAAVPRDVARLEKPGEVEILPIDISQDGLIAAVEGLVGPADGPSIFAKSENHEGG